MKTKRFKLGRMEISLYSRQRRKPRCPVCRCTVVKSLERCFGCGAPTRIAENDTSFIDECNYFDYVSWCFPSETVFIGPLEINIQNRRK